MKKLKSINTISPHTKPKKILVSPKGVKQFESFINMYFELREKNYFQNLKKFNNRT